jgi:hypothetical protein
MEQAGWVATFAEGSAANSFAYLEPPLTGVNSIIELIQGLPLRDGYRVQRPYLLPTSVGEDRVVSTWARVVRPTRSLRTGPLERDFRRRLTVVHLDDIKPSTIDHRGDRRGPSPEGPYLPVTPEGDTSQAHDTTNDFGHLGIHESAFLDSKGGSIAHRTRSPAHPARRYGHILRPRRSDDSI